MHRTFPAATFVLCLVVTVVWRCPGTAEEPKKRTQPRRTPDIVYIPTPHDVVEKMLELAAVTKGDVVYDLGCGDGRIVVAAAKKYGCRAVGCDIDSLRIGESLENVKKNKVAHLVKIRQQDVFKIDLSQASVVTLYLNPRYNVRLIPQFEKMRAGSRIVSHRFGIRGIKPDKIIRVRSEEGGRKHLIYRWTTPLESRNRDRPD